MRRRFNPQPRLDCPPIEEIKLNLNGPAPKKG